MSESKKRLERTVPTNVIMGCVMFHEGIRDPVGDAQVDWDRQVMTITHKNDGETEEQEIPFQQVAGHCKEFAPGDKTYKPEHIHIEPEETKLTFLTPEDRKALEPTPEWVRNLQATGILIGLFFLAFAAKTCVDLL